MVNFGWKGNTFPRRGSRKDLGEIRFILPDQVSARNEAKRVLWMVLGFNVDELNNFREEEWKKL